MKTAQNLSTFFSAFLDGFTGAGLTRKLSIPGEPILGFAPSFEDPAEMAVAHPSRSGVLLSVTVSGQIGPFHGRIREIRYVSDSRTFDMVVESPEGETAHFRLDASSEIPAEHPAPSVQAS
jgi:hypothetical protein